MLVFREVTSTVAMSMLGSRGAGRDCMLPLINKGRYLIISLRCALMYVEMLSRGGGGYGGRPGLWILVRK